MRSIDIRVDVGAAIGATITQAIVGTVHLPDDFRPAEHQVVLFISPGGGYTRQYFDMHFPGHEGYSEAEYHTGRGIVVVAIDHLGVGESSTELGDSLTIEQGADADTAFVREVLDRLREGRIAEGVPAIPHPFVVGAGQSMGGGLTILMQSRSAPFDAIMVLGKSALHTVLPQPTFELFEVQRSIFKFHRNTPLDQLSVALTSERIPDFLYPFHWPEEPQDIIDADMAGGYPLRHSAPPFGSLTVPRYAVGMMSPAYMTPDAARVEVPVLIACGERDVAPDVRREPTAFINSNDISVFVVPRMAHMHNFAPTRRQLWQRTADWMLMQAAAGT
ncbi:MAG TPA: alpha/beta fold hydrolase [Novosphingobium sp.]